MYNYINFTPSFNNQTNNSMPNLRFEAINASNNRLPVEVEDINNKRSGLYCEKVFTPDRLRHYLTKDAYKLMQDTVEKGKNITREIADQVAAGMKSWALGNGATHYTHWFQPLTGSTAEKHDAFF